LFLILEYSLTHRRMEERSRSRSSRSRGSRRRSTSAPLVPDEEDKHGKDSYWCAIDFGGGSTKWAIRNSQSEHWEKCSKWEGTDHQTLWSDPLKVGKRIIDKLEMEGATNISQLGFSLSGIVDHQTQKIIRSDYLNHFNQSQECTYMDFDLPSACQKLCAASASVCVLNDGVAAALGATRGFGRQVELPALVMTLGSNKAIAIVDGSGFGPVTSLTSKESSWMDATLIIDDYGQRANAHRALNGRVLQALDPVARSCRIGQALAVFMDRYATEYKRLPASLVVVGGNSIGLLINDIVGNCIPVPGEVLAKCDASTTRPLVIPMPSSYQEQSSLHLEGARLFANPKTRFDVWSQ